MVRLTRIKKGTNTSANAKKRGILRLLSAPVRYVKPKIDENASNASNHTNVHNNINVSNNDNKIRDKISDIRAILSRLGDIVTKNDREKIKNELYEIGNKKNLSDKEKEKIDDNLLELVNKLNKKEKYRYHDRDDLDYPGIGDVENLFDTDNNEDYYKPILVKSSF